MNEEKDHDKATCECTHEHDVEAVEVPASMHSGEGEKNDEAQPEVNETKIVRMIPPSEFKGQKRLTGETFNEFKVRRRIENLSTKHHLRGRLTWGGGTYRRKDDPFLNSVG